MRSLRFYLLILVFVSLSVVQGLACILEYTLTDSKGNSTPIRPGQSVDLSITKTYTLVVKFTPDHGRCQVPAADTMFLLEEEKWKPGKDYLPLQLMEPVTWQELDSKSYSTTLVFKAQTKGEFSLEVLRECSKGGYDETLSFRIA